MKTVPVKTYYLQMLSRPARGDPPPLAGVEIVRSQEPPVAFYRFLYDLVGRDWRWMDRKRMSDQQLRAVIHDPSVDIYVLYVDGAPAGLGELDRRTAGQIELVYFGLAPEFIGKGLGPWFLDRILNKAWSHDPARVWLHTCEWDHPAALPTYLKAGFVIFDEKAVDHVVP
jgi:GNAT superfamily N-acetyltransferase